MYFLVEADSLETEKVRELDITQKSKPKESKVSITLFKYLCYLIKIKLSKLQSGTLSFTLIPLVTH